MPASAVAERTKRAPARRRLAPDPRTLETIDGVHYPSSDGQRSAENGAQWRCMILCGAVLDVHYRRDPNVYSVGDMLVYPTRGNARDRIAPNIMVIFGVPRRPERANYKVWVEGKAPDFVLEVAAPGKWLRDREERPKRYAKMGVRELWLFDPTGDLFTPRLEGFALRGRVYAPIAPRPSPAGPMLPSRTLRLLLRPDGGLVRFHDPAAGEDLRTPQEEAAAREREATAREREATAREREAAAREREAAAREREATARQREEAAARRREEAAARIAAERRVAELEEQLRQLRSHA